MGSKVTRSLSIEIAYTDFVYFIEFAHTVRNSLVIMKEGVRIHESIYEITPPGSKESELNKGVDFAWLSESMRGVLEQQIRFFTYHFSDVSPTSSLGRPAPIQDNWVLKGDGSNLSSVLYRLEENQPKKIRRLEMIINLAAPFFKEFHIRMDPLNNTMVLLEWMHMTADHLFDFMDLSDGTKRFIGLLSAIFQEDTPKLVLIDEPELGLHPKALFLFWEAVERRSRKIQFILSTQSPRLLDHVNQEDVIVIEYENGESKTKRLGEENLKEWLEDYSLGDLWEKNIIGGRP